MAAANYTNGTGPYMAVSEFEDQIFYHKLPDGAAMVPNLILKPFIDNSTYSTELKNGNINSLLSTPFGATSPILGDTTKFFYKSSIATTFFALYYNCQKLNLEQRKALRALVNAKAVAGRFFKLGTAQQRHVADYRGPGDNYDDYLTSASSRPLRTTLRSRLSPRRPIWAPRISRSCPTPYVSRLA
jgi:hypothetical protein